MDHRVAAVALLLVATALVGCLDADDGDDGAERSALLPGDFVKVRFVERFEDGTVFNSTAGELPPNTTLEDLDPADHDDDWWLLWTDVDRVPRGPTVLTNALMVDLTEDGRLDVVTTFQHTVEPGQRYSNERISLWHIPDEVQDPERIPSPGLLSAMEGLEEGDRLTSHAIPPEDGFAPPSEGLIRTLPRLDTDRPIFLGNQSRVEVLGRSNMTDRTEEGDRIAYQMRGWTVDARVEEIGDRLVDLRLLVEEGQRVRFLKAWNATIQDVGNGTYALNHHAAVEGQRVVDPGSARTGRVTVVNGTTVELDFNDPRAGRTMVYDIEVVETRPLAGEDDLWSREAEPLGGDASVRDVAMIRRHMPTVATSKGVYFNPSAPGSLWFSLDRSLDGHDVRTIEAAHADGVVYAAVAGEGVMRSGDDGRSFEATGGSGLDGLPADLAPSPHDPDLVHALMEDGRILVSRDGGGSWTDTGGSLPHANALDAGHGSTEELWAATGDGVVASRDGGASWNLTLQLQSGVRDVAAFGPRSAYAAAGATVYLTLDDGSGWQSRSTGNVVDRIDASPRFPLFVVGTTSFRPVALSQDGGVNWVSILS